MEIKEISYFEGFQGFGSHSFGVVGFGLEYGENPKKQQSLVAKRVPNVQLTSRN